MNNHPPSLLRHLENYILSPSCIRGTTLLRAQVTYYIVFTAVTCHEKTLMETFCFHVIPNDAIYLFNATRIVTFYAESYITCLACETNIVSGRRTTYNPVSTLSRVSAREIFVN